MGRAYTYEQDCETIFPPGLCTSAAPCRHHSVLMHCAVDKMQQVAHDCSGLQKPSGLKMQRYQTEWIARSRKERQSVVETAYRMQYWATQLIQTPVLVLPATNSLSKCQKLTEHFQTESGLCLKGQIHQKRRNRLALSNQRDSGLPSTAHFQTGTPSHQMAWSKLSSR